MMGTLQHVYLCQFLLFNTMYSIKYVVLGFLLITYTRCLKCGDYMMKIIRWALHLYDT